MAMLYVSVEGKKGLKRRHRRWPIGGRLNGWIDAMHEATLINMSLGGALMEHSNVMRPGTVEFLTFTFQGHEVGLKCRVVHSQVARYVVKPAEDRDLIYRSGLEFLGASDASVHLIEKTIESFRVAA
jgi:hypothetical protein